MMKERIITIALLFCLPPAFVMTFAGCKAKQVEEKVEIRVPVEVRNPLKGKVKNNYITTGTVSAEEESFLGFPGGGRLVEIYVDEGDSVGAGQKLARVDSVQYAEVVNAAEAAYMAATGAVKAQESVLDVSRNQLADARNRFDQIEADYERYKSLYEDQVVTRKEFEGIETAYKSAELAVASASDGVNASELQVGVARAQADAASAQKDQAVKALSDTALYAPYGGVIAEKMSEVGEIAAPGVPVFRITGSGMRKVALKVPEGYIGKIDVGDEVRLTLEYLPDETIVASVSRVTPDVNPDSRAFSVEVQIPAELGALPGSFVQARMTIDEIEDAMTVPMSAVLSFEGENGVFVNEGGVAKRRPVKLGLIEGDIAQIVEGLSWDDEIIVVGNRFLNEGALIEVVQAVKSEQ